MGNNANGREFSWGRGLLSGVVGGLVGTIVMTQFQNAWSTAAQEIKPARRYDSPESDGEKEDATMKVAGKLASVAGRELSHDEKKKLGPLVHYGFGTLQGAIYGTVLEAVGERRGGLIAGLALGAALFALADEIGVSYLVLGSKPSETPLPLHLYALAAHLVYGVSTEVVRKGLRDSL